MTTAFMPFGMGYRGGLSLATGWLTGSLGGAERIVVGQLAGPGDGEGLFQRFGAARRASDVSAQHDGAQPHRRLHRDRQLQPV